MDAFQGGTDFEPGGTESVPPAGKNDVFRFISLWEAQAHHDVEFEAVGDEQAGIIA